MEIHKTHEDEIITDKELMWRFIKSTEQVEVFELFKSALIEQTSIID